ncbi:supporter of activation of yellow protein [Ceratitis capitata]|uniref:supporter of activation of yellow protein n=1 Tax=Ceratitis capitata TaxID=7213 RepID=UPI00032A2A0C|nr:supporter of activation of yellow protein [Ceratitis capitata]XP_004531132.1 supporter of activation of yellow protein [Ceratitis capitata]XP_004531133.1 supporter of activation of yellow protein [Ceratitis capitata]XP_004531134.1 supporter of activation of yellow protein [Ceratitis capitata]XP_012159609.1 supporter of activation of yellow protein [Ceratitis capitata]
MNVNNNQSAEESQQNPPQHSRRINFNSNAALAHSQPNNQSAAEEDQEQTVTSTSCDSHNVSSTGHLPRRLEALITSPARITSSTGNDCSSSPQRVLSTSYSSSSSSGGSGRQSTQNRGDITTTDVSSEDDSQSPQQSTQSSFVGRNTLKQGVGAVHAFARAASYSALDSGMPTTSSAAAATRSAGVSRSVETAHMSSVLLASSNNKISISNISNGSLELSNGSRGGNETNMVAREQSGTTVASTGGDKAGGGHTVSGSVGQSHIVSTEHNTESHKIILKLPKPNATCVNARTSESQSNMEASIADESKASHSGAETTRKVEPLKINLHTHSTTNATIVPKITIKTIVKKHNDIPSSDYSSSAEDDASTEPIGTRVGNQIPKLTIKTSTVGGVSDEPHIVPKLTIRSANDSSDSSVVPRLTIKMSDSQSSCLNQLSPSTSTANSGVTTKSLATDHSPPPLPKLTIKTSLDGTSESIMSTISPASSSSSSSSTSSSAGLPSLSSVTASCTVSNATNACSVPKLTIKALPPKQDELVPKLTIKTNAAGACVSTTAATAMSEPHAEANEAASSSSKIPKLTIKTGQEHAVIITQHNDTSNSQVIPKLTIKTKSLDMDESLSDRSEDPPPEKIPKITIKTHETVAEAATPKFCIKTLQQQTETEHTHSIPKLTISMASLEGSSAPQSPKQSPLIVRQLSSGIRKPESPERLPKLMISRQDTKNINCDVSVEKVVPKLTIKTNSQDSGCGNEREKEKIPKLTIKSIPSNVEQQSSEESDECLSGESSPPLSAAEDADADKVVPKLTIKNLSSPTLRMKAVLEDKTTRNASKKCGKSSDPKGVATAADTNATTVCDATQRALDLQQSIESKAHEQLVNGGESSISQEFCGFNNEHQHTALALEDDIQEPRRNSDDMDIDEGLQNHDPQVFNNIFHVSNGDSLRMENADEADLMQPPRHSEDLTNVVDTVDLTSSPSPGSSPAHFTYTDADPQISDAQQPPQPTILMERLQREMSVIQTAPPLDNRLLLNQLNSTLNASKYGAPPPLQPKPQQTQQQQRMELELHPQKAQNHQPISNSIKYPQLTERLKANGARVHPNANVMNAACNSIAALNTATGSGVSMLANQLAPQPEKVIDSIEILDTPEGSPRLTMDDVSGLQENLHLNNEDGLMNNTARGGAYGENSADILRCNNNIPEDSAASTDELNNINLKRHATVSTLMVENDVSEQCIEITPNKVRRIDSESHTMATLTILTDDESSNTKLITTSPTLFGGNHHVVDITNEVVSTENSTTVTMDLTSPKTSIHRSRKQRHEHLLSIPLDEEDTLQYQISNELTANEYIDNEHATLLNAVNSAVTEQSSTANTPHLVKRRGRPKKSVLNNIVTPVSTSATLTEASNAEDTDTLASDETSKTRRVELLRKRLAIDMIDAEQPLEEQVVADLANDLEASKNERPLRTGARISRRSMLPGGAVPVAAKTKTAANNGEMPLKSRKRTMNVLGATTAATATITTNSLSENVMSVLNHCGGSNSSLSSAYSSSSMSSATVTTAPVVNQPSPAGVLTSISLASQIDLCSSSSSASNGSATATVTIAGGGGNMPTVASSGALNVVVQNQSSSSMLPPATILSSSDPVPDVVFRPNDFSSLMATQQLRGMQSSTAASLETDMLRMQATLSSAKFDAHDDESSSLGGGAFGRNTDLSGDDSNTSSLSTPVSGRGRGGRGRGRGSGRGSGRGTRAHRLGRGASAVAKQIALSRPRCVGGLKHTPDPERMKGLFSPSPQVFEEDTRMSADLSQMQSDPATPIRQPDFLANDESQSSVVSTNSILDPNTVAAVQNGSAIKRPKKKKMEVCVAEDAEITVSAIAEYDWPPPKGCCPSKNRDTFMIQEQVALYLGIKSFKRKYPDLPRRQIDMEERNWLQEKGLVSERMCDLGITAVWASDILDIMYTDFYGKYEEYKDFIRQKHLREIEAKQKALGLNVSGRGLQARERALLSASKWNSYFNRTRKEERLACLDLQTLTMNVPLPATAPTTTSVNRPIAEVVAAAAKAEKIPEPPTLLQPRRTTPPRDLNTSYPVALVPGQYSAQYRQYTPFELSCLPLNTVLQNPRLLTEYLQKPADVPGVLDDKSLIEPTGAAVLESIPVSSVNSNAQNLLTRNIMRRNVRSRYATKEKDDSETESAMSTSESESESETDSDSDTDSSSDEGSSATDEEFDTPATCGVCQRIQNRNLKNLPEVFIRCYTCRRKVHPSCVEMPSRMVTRVRNYNWQCVDCKCCIKCKGKQDQNKMLYCEQCDRGFHIYCLDVKAVPDGRWSCDRCSICMRCGATKPEGLPQTNMISPNGEKIKPIKHKKVKWINEYRIDHITKLREHCSMLCVPCGRAKNVKRVQIASPAATVSAAPHTALAPVSAQQKQQTKTLAQAQSANATTTTSANDQTAPHVTGKGGAAAAKANSVTNKASATGTLAPPPPPPPVVA